MIMRSATEPELDHILTWAAGEGWNPGLEDGAAFFAADPEGFFVAEKEGVVVAAISVVNHSEAFAFLGLYLCRPEFRGQGIGYSLWTYALAHCDDRAVGLDGVADQEANYALSGFVKTGATIRYEGSLVAEASPNVRLATPGDASVIAALDRQANGISRPRFLKAWTAPGATRKSLVLQSDAVVSGFATIRRCGQGVKIGPVVAPDATRGLELVQAALTEVPSDLVIIDVPSDNAALTELLREAGFESSFATARMWRGAVPVTGPGLQAIATMELG